MDDFISREDTIDKMQEVDWYHQNKNGEMVHGANSSEHQAWYKAEDVYKVLEDMPPAQPDLIAKIQNGINTTNANDSYSCGMRNGMRWCMSLVDGKEPLFENCPSVQPESCEGCKDGYEKRRNCKNGKSYKGGIMTYKEAYSKAESLDELKQMAIKDASYIFCTEDRYKAIEKAMNEVAEEKGWNES